MKEAAFDVLAGHGVAAGGGYRVSTVGARQHGIRLLTLIPKGRVERSISKGPVPLFGLKVWVPAPDQLPPKVQQRKRLASTDRTLYCGRVYWIRSWVRRTFAVPYSDESSQLLCAKDFSLTNGGAAGSSAAIALLLLNSTIPSGNAQLPERIPFLLVGQPVHPTG